MNFTCKRCGSHRLEEVMTDVVVSSEITDVGEGGDIEYGNVANDGGVVDRYQCLNCGEKVATDLQELCEVLGVPGRP